MARPKQHRSLDDRGRYFVGVVTLVLVLIGGCGGETSVELRVSAASSLTVAFSAIEEEFERVNPDVDVVLNLGASSLLREQITSGAPVDVFAPADAGIMSRLEVEGFLDGAPMVFARNSMTIAVPTGNPGDVTSVEDFSRSDLLLGVCAEGVPCGELARAILDAAGTELAAHSEEPNVRALLTKVDAGELDAGIVYVTDVLGEGVTGVQISDNVNQMTDYPIAVIADADNPDEASRFVEFVLSDAGQRILASNRFDKP